MLRFSVLVFYILAISVRLKTYPFIWYSTSMTKFYYRRRWKKVGECLKIKINVFGPVFNMVLISDGSSEHSTYICYDLLKAFG